MTNANDYFARKLTFETDVADVAEALRQRSGGEASGRDRWTADFTVVDTRSERAYAEGHIPGAISLAQRGLDGLPDGPLVVYCWGPACNGATKAGAMLAAAGREVKEMIGGYEYWVREGNAVATAETVGT